jgi:hypothetical protein
MRSKMVRRSLAAAALALCGACGSDSLSPREACDETVEVVCAKLFECLTEGERQFFGLTTEAACISNGKQNAGCAEVTADNVCEGSQTYNGSNAAECLDQIEAVSCGQARDGTVEEDAPACAEVCQAD